MITHLMATVHCLLGRFPDAEIVFAGDRNELSLDPIIRNIPGLKQVATGLTHKAKTLET